MSIKCGNHGTENIYHPTILDVRACCAGAKGGEKTYGDVILTTGELAKIDAGIRDMEREGILPRSNRGAFTATAPARQAVRVTPKGRQIEAGFGGSGPQYDFIYDLLEQLGGVSPEFRWDVIVSTRLASQEIDRLKDRVREERSAKVRSDFHEVYSDGAAYDAKDVKRMEARTAAVFAPSSNANDLATTDGIFRNPETGEIFKGQFNRAQGDGRRLYFKRLVLETSDWPAGPDIVLTSIPLTGEKSASAKLSWDYAGGAAKAGVKASWLMTPEDAEAFGELYGVCVRCHRDLTKEESIERGMGPICAGKQAW
jgi:hypothetical protein